MNGGDEVAGEEGSLAANDLAGLLPLACVIPQAGLLAGELDVGIGQSAGPCVGIAVADQGGGSQEQGGAQGDAVALGEFQIRSEELLPPRR